jgi:hypothetical protein
MANKSILAIGAKVSSVEQTYYSPVAVVPPYTDIPVGTTYCFLSSVDPWDDDNNPPVPGLDQKYIKQTLKNMFVAKKITSSDLSPVIQRVDWVYGSVYDHYSDDIDILELDTNGLLNHTFYVKNKYDQVFKCLWNNNDTPSTVEPYFEPGSYNTNNIYQGIDGYKWKFMFTIDTGLKVKFMDETWIPVQVGNQTPNPLVKTDGTTSVVGSGSIDVINVINGGSGYDPANSVISVSITGDGTGAAATAVVVNSQIHDIIVTNPGSNYTYANISIISSTGSGAVVVGPTSPVGGHGFDPISELGCTHVMYTVEFNGSESDIIPTDIVYHQIGLVINPTSQSQLLLARQLGLSSIPPASDPIYKTTTDFVVAPGFGQYTSGEVVYQGTTENIADATFTAKVLSFDVASNLLRLINTTGTPTTNAPVRNTPRTNRTLLTFSYPDYSLLSGYLAFIENRSGIQRSTDGIEQVRLVLGY